MYLTFEVEDGWFEPGIGWYSLGHEPRLVLYENGDQGQTEVASIALSAIFESWENWKNSLDT